MVKRNTDYKQVFSRTKFKDLGLEVYTWSQNIIFLFFWPNCSSSYPISLVLGNGGLLNPLRNKKMWSGEEKFQIMMKIAWIITKYLKQLIFIIIFKSPYFWTGIRFFQSVKLKSSVFCAEYFRMTTKGTWYLFMNFSKSGTSLNSWSMAK